MLRAGFACLLLALAVCDPLEREDKSGSSQDSESCPPIKSLNYTRDPLQGFVEVVLEWKHPTYSVTPVSSYGFIVCARTPCSSYDVTNDGTKLRLSNLDYWADFNVTGYAYCQRDTLRSDATVLRIHTGPGGPRKSAFVSAAATSPTAALLFWVDPTDSRRKPNTYSIQACSASSSCVSLTVAQNGSDAYQTPLVNLKAGTHYGITVTAVISENGTDYRGPFALAHVSTPNFQYDPIRGLNYSLEPKHASVDVVLTWLPPQGKKTPCCTKIEVCHGVDCAVHELSTTTRLVLQDQEFWSTFEVKGYACYEEEDGTMCSNATEVQVQTGPGNPRKPAYAHLEAAGPTTIVLEWTDPTKGRRAPDEYHVEVCTSDGDCKPPITKKYNMAETYAATVGDLSVDTLYKAKITALIELGGKTFTSLPAEVQVTTPKSEYNPIRSLNYSLEPKHASVDVVLTWLPPQSKKTPCCTKIEVCHGVDCAVHEQSTAARLVLQDQEFWSTFAVRGYACYKEEDGTVCSNATEMQVETGSGNPRKPAYAHLEAATPTTIVLEWTDPTKGRKAPDEYHLEVCTSAGDCKPPITKKYNTDETYAATVGDLSVDTLYKGKITAVIEFGGKTFTSLPAEVQVTTPKSDFLGPEDFEAKVRRKEKLADVLLTWKAPANVNPNLVGYKFEVCSHGKNCSILTSGTDRKFTVKDLNYWSDFIVNAYAIFKDYGATIESPPVSVNVSTGPVAPWVDNLYVEAENSHSILVRWEGPHNDHVTVFHLSACPLDSENCTMVPIPSTPVDVYQEVFGALKPWTNYTISVVGVYNDSGHVYTGSTVKQVARTLPGAPDAVQNATIHLTNRTTVSITWKEPAVLRGPLDGYFVHCATVHEAIPVTLNDTVERDVTSVVVDLAEQQSNFECDISAFNLLPSETRIYGKEYTLHIRTKGIPSPKHLNVTKYDSTNVTLEWDVNPYAKNFSVRVLKDDQDIQQHNLESDDITGHSQGTHTHVILGLVPWTAYDILVSDCSSYCGKESLLHVKTDVAAPSEVRNFSVSVTDLVQLSFQWKTPEHHNGPLDGYRLVISSRESGETIAYTLGGNETKLQTNVSDFYTKYRASIVAFNNDSRHRRIDFGSELFTNFTTKGPGPAPPYPHSSDLEDKSAVLEWQKPDDEHKIVGYAVYVLHGGSEVVFNSTTNATKVTVTNLHPWTVYVAHVASCEEKKRCGPVFKQLEFRTDVDAPSVPRDLNATDVGESWIRVAWERPEFPYGPVDGYEVEWNNGSGNSSAVTNHTSFNVTDLPSGTACTVKVLAFNNGYREEKRGKAAEVSAVTASAPSGVSRTTIILAVVLPLICIVLCIAGYIVYKKLRKRNESFLLTETE